MWALFLSFAFWAAMFFLDAAVTTSCRDLLKYETNALFRFLAARFSMRVSVAVQAASEAGLGFATSYMFDPRSCLEPMAVIALVFGLAHLEAWHSNTKFLGRKTK